MSSIMGTRHSAWDRVRSPLVGPQRGDDMETLSESIQAAIRISSVPPPAEHIPMAREIMVSERLIVFRPEQLLSEVIATMVRRSISGAPVVGYGMRLLGVISEYDCLRVVAAGAYDGERLDCHRTVEEVMSTNVTAIAPDLNLYGIAHLFATRRLRRLPVVNDGIVLGQVSRRDALRAIDRMI